MVRAATGYHDCPVSGCTRTAPANMLMCRADWLRLPKAFRDAVYRAWDDGRGAGTAAHRAAADAAIAAAERARTEPPPPMPTWDQVIEGILGECIDHEHHQVGPCVYCRTCGRRLYQGRVLTPDELAELRTALAEVK